jgi:hypothetical protein
MAPMAERAGRFYRALAEGALLAAALVVPLWFAIFTVQVFEPAKAALLRGLVLLAVVAWGLAWWAWRGERSGWRTLAWRRRRRWHPGSASWAPPRAGRAG